MIGPTKRPQDFGFKQGDTHIVVNDIVETAKAYDFSGKLLWEIPALARGQGSDIEFRVVRTDTPPGLYKLGIVYKDFERVGANPAFDRTLAAYGWYSFDMNELEGQVSKYGRSGIMLHGGGSAAGWPGAWAPKQPLFATHGCVRIYNIDLRDKILPLYNKGTVYISVYQEANPAIKPPVVSKPETTIPSNQPIKFTDAAKFYKEEPQQVDAFNYLESKTPDDVKKEFAVRYRNSSQPKEIFTKAQLQHVWQRTPTDAQVKELNEALQRFDITTKSRLAHFISQISHESGGGKWMKDPRIMEGVDYVADKYPGTSAGYWWMNNKMNALCDTNPSVEQVTRRVNGGTNGLADRQMYYKRCLEIL
jgi:hypothetical protein